MGKPLVFISHVAKDKEYARKLVNALRHEGTVVWWACDSPAPGARWYDEVAKHLEQSNVFIALVSPDFLSSEWGMFELGAALARRWDSSDSLVLPVLIHGVRLRDLPRPLQHFHTLDWKLLGPQGVSKKLLTLIREGVERGSVGAGPRRQKVRGATT